MTPETAVVLFTPFESSGRLDNLNRRVSMMLNRLGFFQNLREGDLVAVKVHPGERDNITHLRPSLVRSCVEQLLRRKTRPFVAETTTLYCRERFTPAELLETAAGNGFCERTLGCDFLVADAGQDRMVEVNGRYLGEVGVAGKIAEADALLVLSHVTGHCWTAGLAGAVKQLGMGCVGRNTKAEVHRSTTITINPELCDACGKCESVCKSDGIRVTEDSAVLTERCVRCGVCIGSCPRGAVGFEHDYRWFGRALAEAASGVVSLFPHGKVAFVNYLIDLTWHCDCEYFSDNPVFPDLGVLAATDPVAADQASGDLVNGSTPLPGARADLPGIIRSQDKMLSLTGIDWQEQLREAREAGLGVREYDLKRLKR